MNGEQELARYITSMEQEVLNLKTAHQRPLGTLNFFKKTLNFAVSLLDDGLSYYRDVRVIVKVVTPTAKPPIVQTGWDTPPNFYTVLFTDFSVNSNYDTWTYELSLSTTDTVPTTTMKVSTVSSQPIESITWEYI